LPASLPHELPPAGSLRVASRPWLGAVMISFSAVWVRLADVEPARSALLRGVYALPVLAVLVATRGRGGRERWLVPGAFLAGLLMGIDIITWHESIAIIGAGLGTVLPNLQVVFVGIAGVLLFRERPKATFWVALPIVLAGIWLLSAVGEPVAEGASVLLGVTFGIAAAVTYAACLVVLRLTRVRTSGPAAVTILWSLTLGATVAMAPVAVAEGVAGPAGWPEDGWLAALAVGSQVVGWLLLTSSIHQLPAAATSVALLLQPVLALVWGALLLAEPLGASQIGGALIVLLGVVLAHRAASRPLVTAVDDPVAPA